MGINITPEKANLIRGYAIVGLSVIANKNEPMPHVNVARLWNEKIVAVLSFPFMKMKINNGNDVAAINRPEIAKGFKFVKSIVLSLSSRELKREGGCFSLDAVDFNRAFVLLDNPLRNR